MEGDNPRLIAYETENKSYTDSGLAIGQEYSYYVDALNGSGGRSRSSTVAASTNAADTTKPEALICADTVGYKGINMSFVGGLSSDNVGIVSYLWDFGDGTTANTANAEHIYQSVNENGYTVTLTVTDGAGNSNSMSQTVKVYENIGYGALELTVQNSGGSKLSNAYVFIDFADGSNKHYVTDENGKVFISAIEGHYDIAAYYQGYLPKSENIEIAEGTTQSAVIKLSKGEVASANTYVKPATKEELLAAGVDTTAEENRYVYTIVTELSFEKKKFELPAMMVNGEGGIITGGAPIHYGGGVNIRPIGGGGGSNSGGYIFPKPVPVPNHPEVPPTLVYLVIPTTVSWLKEFFNVYMVVSNDASPQFVIQDASVELSLPEGLSLAPTAKPQNMTISLGDIAGGGAGMAEWLIRGDTAGEYDVDANFSGTLMPFEAEVNADFQAGDMIRVLAEQALKMYISAPDMAYIGEKYYVQFKIINQGYNVLNDVSISFPGGSGNSKSYIVESIDDTINLPFINSGDSISIEEMLPGEIIGGTLALDFPGTGDPTEEYYELVEGTITQNGSEVGIPVEFEVIPNIVSEAMLMGDAIEEIGIGEIRGLRYFDCLLYYNSAMNIWSDFGKNWTHPLDVSLYTDEY